MQVSYSAKSFTGKLAECDERIARAERNIARQRGNIARMARHGLGVNLARQALHHSIALLEEMKKVRAYVLKYYGYSECQLNKRPRLQLLNNAPAEFEEESHERQRATVLRSNFRGSSH